MSFRLIFIAGAAAAAAVVSGCADNQSLLGTQSSNLTTSAVASPAAPKVDPACAGLASQIDGLRKEGIADKVDKAAQKKQKVSLTATETAKADQLNKANLEFQAKCSNYKPVVAAVAPAAAPAAAAAATTNVKAAATTASTAAKPAQ